MSDDGGKRLGRPQAGKGEAQAAAEAEVEENAPKLWIYRNLTPWRIHACFTADGELLARGTGDQPDGMGAHGCDKSVVKVLSIPALGEVTVPDEDARDLNTLDMRRLGQVEVRPAPSELWNSLPRATVIFGWLAVGLLFGGWALFFGGGSALPWAWVVAAVVAVPVMALITAAVREIRLYARFSRYRRALSKLNAPQPTGTSTPGEPGRRSLEGVERGSRVRTFVDGMPRHAAEVAVLIGAVIVSVVGLGVAIHLTTQLNELLPIDYGALLRLDDPFADVGELARSSPAFWQLLVGHIAQWVLVSVAALAPAAMYFQFDRQRLASVQRRWVQEVFRLDPTVRTVRDIEAKYGSQIETSFGDLGPDSSLRLSRGRRSPVIVATILLVIGWFLVISATHVPKLVPVETPDLAATAPAGETAELMWPVQASSGEAANASDGETSAPGVANDRPFPIPAFFRPELSLVGYAFLGAYVFTLFHVIRGYQRRDLHPRTYNTVVVRILAAYVLALVVGVVYHGPTAEVLMFFVGFMPQSALVWLREKLAEDKGVWSALPLREPAPLTELEGIDLYDRTRLAEEGINNVEALAHADIVDLMSSTRISAAQLVDWTDQAILYLRVGGDAIAQVRHENRTRAVRRAAKRIVGANADDPGGPSAPGSNGVQPDRATVDGADATTVSGAPAAPKPPTDRPSIPDARRNLCHLRSFGIRTATDLLQAYEQALRRGGEDPARRAAEIAALRVALDLPHAPQHATTRSIQLIIDTLPDEEWFVQVRNWRRPEFGAADAWYSYLDGHDWTLQCPAQLPKRVQEAMCQFVSMPMIDEQPSSVAPADTNATDTPEASPSLQPAGIGNGGQGQSPPG
ncbi:MAG: hypothetical protein AB7Q42_07725 [Acidimicrobiia bacterium]